MSLPEDTTVSDAARESPPPLWVVVDTNRLASDELRALLAASPDNRAVLPDYVAMERLKPDDIETFREGLSVLSEFSDQVIILKSTGEISQLDPDRDPLPEAMIDADQTEGFERFCALVDQAAKGDMHLSRQLREHAARAQAHLEVVRAGAMTFAAELDEFEAFFTPAELSLGRKGGRLSSDMNGKFDRAVIALAENVFRNSPIPLTFPSAEAWPSHFVLRNALCTAVYMLRFSRRGVRARQPAKARNDVVDVLLATYGTYFNGVMSEDVLTNEVHHVGRYILQTAGVAMRPDYLELLGGFTAET